MKSKFLKVMQLLCLLFLLSSCSFNYGELPNEESKDSSIYTIEGFISDENNSVLKFDLDLSDSYKEIPLSSGGYTELLSIEDSVIAIDPYNSRITEMYENEILNHELDYKHPIRYISTRGTQFTIYNYDKVNDINYYTYVVSNKFGKKREYRLKGIPRKITKNENYIVIYIQDLSTNNLSKQSTFRIYDLKKNKFLEDIPINLPFEAISLIADESNNILFVGEERSNDEEVRLPKRKVFKYSLETDELVEITKNLNKKEYYPINIVMNKKATYIHLRNLQTEKSAIYEIDNNMFKPILLNSEYIESFEINGKSLFTLTKEKDKSQLIKIDIKSGDFIKKVDVPFETRQLIIE